MLRNSSRFEILPDGAPPGVICRALTFPGRVTGGVARAGEVPSAVLIR